MGRRKVPLEAALRKVDFSTARQASPVGSAEERPRLPAALFRELREQARLENRTYLMEHECKELLEGMGIATTGHLVAGSEDEAAEMAHRVGYPVVLKIVSPDVVHKSDSGGVRLNLHHSEEVRKAYREIVGGYRFQHVVGVAVQPMAVPGIEAIVGVTRDPNFGPVLMFGLGGIFVEVLKDVTFRVLPITDRDAEEMIREIKGYPLLKGHRGKSADLAALKSLLLRISALVVAFPEIRELDLNPVFLYEQGHTVVDARIFIGETTDAETAAPPAANLKKFFYPKSIAVLGASGSEGKLGYNVLWNLLNHGFKGRIYPINPKSAEIQGVKAYPAIAAVPDAVDVAIVIVPAEAAPAAIEECCAKGVRFIVVETAGFAETGEAGKRVQARLKEVIETHGCRILGPNCSGVLNTHHSMVQSIGLIGELGKGNLGLVAQAGVYAAGIITGLRNVMDFGIVATIGNKMDISETDILEFLGDDKHIDVIAMYMEDVTSGRRFVDVARSVTRKKPIIALKSGRTEAGKKAVSSHTASLAGNDEINSAAFRQSGIIRARDNEHLFGLMKAFAKQPLPQGDGILVVTYTGSLGVAATDTLYLNGLRLADLEPELKTRLQRIIPDYVTTLNPVDYSFSMEPGQLKQTIEIGLESADVSGFIAVIQGEILGSFVDVLKKIDTRGKPLVACVACKEFMMADVIRMERAGIPVYSTVEMAAEALAAMRRYRLYREEASK
ncbi:MAG: acetate--CoA ligase family protein [Deltaproteobacteria bacterium]|nr:acetate--CoA ligase family protein [Deltaproteobacteria bacterium]